MQAADPKQLWSAFSRLVEMAGGHAPLEDVLDELAVVACTVTAPGTRSGVFVHDLAQARLLLAAHCGLTDDYAHAIEDGLPVRADYPSCGRAAATGEEVIVPALAQDPAWRPFLPLAQAHGITACWSFPIRSNSAVLGTLAVYHDRPRAPQPGELVALRYLATLASAAIGRDADGTGGSTAGTRPLPHPATLPPPGERTGEGLASILPFMSSDWRALDD